MLYVSEPEQSPRVDGGIQAEHARQPNARRSARLSPGSQFDQRRVECRRPHGWTQQHADHAAPRSRAARRDQMLLLLQTQEEESRPGEMTTAE